MTMNDHKETIFISGIDTDAGKSYATGWLACQMAAQGRRVATMKFIQTGCDGRSEDIEIHRRLTGTPLPEDYDLTTAPQIFSYPASPHLAARIDGRSIDFEAIDSALRRLSECYDTVLVEGAGGLMVPLTDEMLTIDYPLQRNMPVALVTNGRLGSINHTILSLEAIVSRGMKLHSLLYNTHFDTDVVIAPDTQAYMRAYVERHFPGTPFMLVPTL